MTVCGKHGKTTKLFSHPSHKPWKSLRDSHIPSALRLIISIQFPKQKGAFLNCLFLSLQAHLSIRKDWARQSNLGNHGGAVTSFAPGMYSAKRANLPRPKPGSAGQTEAETA